jgi:phosphoserine phosphatase
MTVRKIWVDGTTFDVTGQGYDPEGQILLEQQKVKLADREVIRRLCEIAAFDNMATLTPPLDRRRHRWGAIGDTTDAALLALSLKGGFDGKRALAQSPRITLIPFDSTRKMMTSVHRHRDGRIVAYVKGAAQVILERAQLHLHGGREEALTAQARKTILDQVDRFAADAFRVIALAYRILPSDLEAYSSETVEEGLTFAGLVAIYDPPRPDVAEAVLKARGAGVKVVMITGDHELTAEAISRRVGIITRDDRRVVTGTRLTEMSEEELSTLLDADEIVFARITPEQKHKIVKAFQSKGEIVAVTGDGVNDAPALAEVYVGIAMGISGTDVARESADMVLLDDSFASIVSGIELGRGVFDNLKKFIIYVFSHNWAELMSFVAFVLLGAPVAIGVVQVLSIDLVMDIPPSLALTVEPPEPKVMERPPRGPKSRLFDLGALLTSAYVGVPVGLAAVLAGFAVWSRSGWSLGKPLVTDPVIYAQGVAVVIAGIMMGQVGNVFAQRSHRESTFAVGLRRNRWLLPALAVTLGILLAYIYVPFLQVILQTAPVSPGDWVYIVLLAPLVVTLEEIRKLVARRVYPTPPIPVPVIVPTASLEASLLPSAKARPVRRAPAPTVAAPVLVALFVRPGSWSAARVGLDFAESAGSKVIVARVFDGATEASSLAEFEEGIDQLARAGGVPYEFIDVRFPSEAAAARGIGSALERIASRADAATVVVPVERKFFDRRAPDWLEQLAAHRVLLVSGPPQGPPPGPWPRRLLIPVLKEFQQEPFEIAAALTATSVVPEVDVVAARVIRLPATMPLYSTFSPEALVDKERELSFLRGIRTRQRLRGLSPRVLLVRNVARDLVEFAAKREMDAIILQGDWGARGHGFLGHEERRTATRATCGVIVVLPARKDNAAVEDREGSPSEPEDDA